MKTVEDSPGQGADGADKTNSAATKHKNTPRRLAGCQTTTGPRCRQKPINVWARDYPSEAGAA